MVYKFKSTLRPKVGSAGMTDDTTLQFAVNLSAKVAANHYVDAVFAKVSGGMAGSQASQSVELSFDDGSRRTQALAPRDAAQTLAEVESSLAVKRDKERCKSSERTVVAKLSWKGTAKGLRSADEPVNVSAETLDMTFCARKCP